MRRLGRYLLTFCSVISLLLVIALLTAWGVGLREFGPQANVMTLTTDGFLFCNYTARFDNAGIWFSHEHTTAAPRAPGEGYFDWHPATGAPFSRRPRLRLFRVTHTKHPYEFEGFDRDSFLVPYWSALGVSVVLPAMWWRRRRRAARARRAGQCVSCGYDLRAHSGGERCPECGTAVGGRE